MAGSGKEKKTMDIETTRWFRYNSNSPLLLAILSRKAESMTFPYKLKPWRQEEGVYETLQRLAEGLCSSPI